jgi:hypothetical protein
MDREPDQIDGHDDERGEPTGNERSVVLDVTDPIVDPHLHGHDHYGARHERSDARALSEHTRVVELGSLRDEDFHRIPALHGQVETGRHRLAEAIHKELHG